MLKAKPIYTKILSFGCRLCFQFQGPKGRRAKLFFLKLISRPSSAYHKPNDKGAFELTKGNGTKLHIEKLFFGKGSKYRRPLTVLLPNFNPFLEDSFLGRLFEQPLTY